MDDIGIAMRTDMKGHTAAVRNVLQVALDHNLYFKPEKCTFHAPSMDYLGVILEKGVTRMDLVKIAGIKNVANTNKPSLSYDQPLDFSTFIAPLLKDSHTSHDH